MALITTAEAAQRLGRSPYTLADWRRDGYGPPYVRLRSDCLYEEADLEAFVASQKATSLAEERARLRADENRASTPQEEGPTPAGTGVRPVEGDVRPHHINPHTEDKQHAGP